MNNVPVPLHLETEDKFLFGLTLRQCLLLFVGSGMSYILFLNIFDMLPDPTMALVVGLIIALLFFLFIVAIAFVHRGGRGLEEWGLVLLVYLSQPKVYTWHFNTPDAFERLDLQLQEQFSVEEQEKEEEEW